MNIKFKLAKDRAETGITFKYKHKRKQDQVITEQTLNSHVQVVYGTFSLAKLKVIRGLNAKIQQLFSFETLLQHFAVFQRQKYQATI